MPNSAMFALLLAAGALAPGAALGQRPVELAMRGGPQPHFVAAWAPEKEREAERSAALAGRVALELADVSLDEALKTLTNEAGLNITYSPAVLPAGKRVTIKAGDIAVVTALTEMLFRSGLDVVVDQDGTLALVPCKHADSRAEVQDSGTIVGTVTDKTTRSPLAGVTVAIEGTRLSASTNNEGQYRIARVEAGTYTARARYIGYAVLSSTVTVKAEEEVTLDFGLEKSTQKLDELVTVTPGGMQAEARALSTPVSVIRASDIEQQHPRTLQQLFRQAIPGATSWDFPARPDAVTYSVRGATTLNPFASQMKVLVDGIQVADATNTPIDPNSIERIEVTRGPQAAALYGSDAIGGVVQIFTKHGDPSLTRPLVHAEGAAGLVESPYGASGSTVRQNYSASLQGGGADMSYNVGGGYSRTGDWLPNGEISKQSNPRVFGGVRFARGILAIDMSGRYSSVNAPSVVNPEVLGTGFLPVSRPQFTPVQSANKAVATRLTLTANQWWGHTLSLGVDDREFTSLQARPRLTTPSDTLLTVLEATYSRRWIGYSTEVHGALGPALSGSVTAGFDHYSLPQSSLFNGSASAVTGSLPSSSATRLLTNNTGYFAQGQLGFREALWLTAGVRAEENTNFGDSLGTPISPRVGLSFVRSVGGATLKLRGSWGRGIRAPDPSLRLQLGPNSIPSPRLAPERQQGWDAGVDLILGDGASVGVTYYDQTAENLIQNVRVQNEPVPLDQFQNVGRVKNRGVEFEGSLSIGWIDLRGNYAFTRARIEDLGPTYTGNLRVGEQVHATPKHSAGLLVSAAPRPGTNLTLGMAYVGRFTNDDLVALFRCLGATGPCTPDFNFVLDYPDFVKMNVGLTQRITPFLSGFLSVDNLGNSTAFEFSNIWPQMGRISTIGLRLQY